MNCTSCGRFSDLMHRCVVVRACASCGAQFDAYADTDVTVCLRCHPMWGKTQ